MVEWGGAEGIGRGEWRSEMEWDGVGVMGGWDGRSPLAPLASVVAQCNINSYLTDSRNF